MISDICSMGGESSRMSHRSLLHVVISATSACRNRLYAIERYLNDLEKRTKHLAKLGWRDWWYQQLWHIVHALTCYALCSWCLTLSVLTPCWSLSHIVVSATSTMVDYVSLVIEEWKEVSGSSPGAYWRNPFRIFCCTSRVGYAKALSTRFILVLIMRTKET